MCHANDAFSNLSPGGYLEHTEIEIKARCDDNTGRPDSQLEWLADFTNDMGAAHGNTFRVAENMGNMMREAGFTEVREAKYKLPLGWWSADPKYREIGKFYERFFKTGLQGWLMHIMTRNMGVCLHISVPSVLD